MYTFKCMFVGVHIVITISTNTTTTTTNNNNYMCHNNRKVKVSHSQVAIGAVRVRAH